MPALSSADRFARCEAVVARLEGGYANNPKDPGGPTCMGVTLRALSAHRGGACTVADVRALTPAEAATIYRETYWPAVRGDDLPAGVDLITFDAAVNCGRGRAVTFLQLGLGIAHDGTLGAQTLDALGAEHDRPALVERIRVARAAYYRSLEGFPVFGVGWLRRLATVAATSTSWATRV